MSWRRKRESTIHRGLHQHQPLMRPPPLPLLKQISLAPNTSLTSKRYYISKWGDNHVLRSIIPFCIFMYCISMKLGSISRCKGVNKKFEYASSTIAHMQGLYGKQIYLVRNTATKEFIACKLCEEDSSIEEHGLKWSISFKSWWASTLRALSISYLTLFS